MNSRQPSWLYGKTARARDDVQLDTAFCVFALEEASAYFGRPELFNTGQGSQFTSAAFTGTLGATSQDLDRRSRALDG